MESFASSASQDNIRLWNVSADAQAEATSRSRVAPFKIIAGHHGGTISQICMFLMIAFGLWRALMMSAIILDGLFRLFG
jgi:hypothetical protein